MFLGESDSVRRRGQRLHDADDAWLAIGGKIREIRRDMPIILTSGYIRSEDRTVAQRLHIDQIIYKSITADELADTLAEEIWRLNSASNQACNSPVEDAHRHGDAP